MPGEKNMAEMVTKLELENAKVDAKDWGEAVNEIKVITPRYGDPFKSGPMAIQEIEQNGAAAVVALNAKADEVVAQGFYKGFPTETALKASLPTVSEMRARADDTRKIWRWNRTSAEGVAPVTGTWTDTGLSDKEIAAADATTKATAAEVNAKIYADQKTALKADGVLGKNLFDRSKVFTGKGLGDTGGEITAAGRNISDFISVLPSTAYSFTNTVKVCFYDANKNFVQLSTGALANVISHASTAYLRIDVLDASVASAQVEKGALKTSYEGYGVFLTQEAFAKIQLNISKQQTDFLYRSSPNLFNPATAIVGMSVSNTTGALYASPTITASDYIPVLGSTIYSQTEGNYFAEYDANKVFVQGGASLGITTFTTNVNTRFVRVSVRNTVVPIYIFSRTDAPANYVPYNRWYLDNSIQVASSTGASKWAGKTWNVLADSIGADPNSYWRPVAAMKEINTNAYAIGGTAIAVRAAPYDTNAMCVRYADMANNADLITIAGGTNDFIQCPLGTWAVRNNTTVYGAMRQMCEGLIAKYPAATIAGILPPQRYNANVETYAYTFRKLIDVLKECYHFYGIPTLDLSTAVGFFRPYDPANKALYTVNTTVPEGDGLHPNKIAHDRIAVTVATWLETI
ncbi:MAG: SGNH/GDSL hydrolase family protein [Acinetobacter sp.]